MTQVMVRWRNDNAKVFENERTQEITEDLDYLYFHVPGIYRTRQYEISFTGDLPFILVNLEEEVRPLVY